jgi:chromosome segregation ATPase
MSEIASASINSFGTSSPEADFVPPSEDPVFILTSDQLQYLITRAIQEGAQGLQDEISDLQATVDAQGSQIAALEATADKHEENELFQLRLINGLREATKKEPQPMQKDRGDILRALLAANGGKMLATDARKKMHLSRSRFSELLATIKDEIEARPYHLNKSWQVLVLE